MQPATGAPPQRLATRRWGDRGGPRLVLVHGFTQTGRAWGPAGEGLGASHDVVALDAPGHGGSAGVVAGPWAAADLAADAGGPGTWLGYSLGARLALHVALAHPDVVHRLVLVSGTAGIADPAERAQRRAADEALAVRVEASGVAAFLDEWLALPLFAGLGPATDQRAARLANTPAGLASSLRTFGTGHQDALWDRLGELAGRPVLVVVGADDPKFAALGRRLVDGIGPSATFVAVPGCGHTPHLEAPDAFLAAVVPWLAGA